MRILIINPAQFGYSDEYYYYVKYLSKKGHEIEYYCLDRTMPRIDIPEVRVYYMKLTKSTFNWRLKFFQFIKKIRFGDFDVIVLNHHKLASLYRLFGVPHRAILDIRTGDLSQGNLKRKFWNFMLKFDTLFYSHITILSVNLKEKLKLNHNKCALVRIGADIISESPKEYYPPRFLYIGTLDKRNIQHTIEGLSLFSEKYPEVPLRYDIVGFGNRNVEKAVQESIEKSRLRNEITFHGRKNYTELKPYFDAANIGFSYVPVTPYFDCQPSTKTFEYILSGIICIATNTYENKKIIQSGNGILCDDSPESLSSAIEEYYCTRESFNHNKIRNSLLDHQWENIVDKELEPLLSSLCHRNE